MRMALSDGNKCDVSDTKLGGCLEIFRYTCVAVEPFWSLLHERYAFPRSVRASGSRRYTPM